MAQNDLAVRFTEDKYATRSDVIRDLKTSLVDNIWKNILLYRQQYNVKLGLHNFSSTEYVLCFTESLDARHTLLQQKILKTKADFLKIEEEDLPSLKFKCHMDILKEVARNNNLEISDGVLRSILKGEIRRAHDNDNLVLERYIEALDFIKNNYQQEINEEFIMECHRILSGTLFSSYRNTEDNNPNNKVLIDRIYTCAPKGQIENLMNELFYFIENKDIPSLTKACIAYYTFTSIKPFTTYSPEVALLIMKAILAKDGLDDLALYVPFEALLNLPHEEENRLYTDVQKYSDITYFVIRAYSLYEPLMEIFHNNLISFSSDIIENEMYSPDVEEEIIEEKEKSLAKEEIKEITPKKQEKKIERVEEVKEVAAETAIRYVPKGLDEKEAAKLEIQLLEMDPSLKKKEAHFYAHHCTLGMNYTIQHYKRYCRVSYETARTSMDHLAELGYYKKMQLKNKFIYTPIKMN